MRTYSTQLRLSICLRACLRRVLSPVGSLSAAAVATAAAPAAAAVALRCVYVGCSKVSRLSLSGIKDKAVTGYVLYRTAGELIADVSLQPPYDETVRWVVSPAIILQALDVRLADWPLLVTGSRTKVVWLSELLWWACLCSREPVCPLSPNLSSLPTAWQTTLPARTLSVSTWQRKGRKLLE